MMQETIEQGGHGGGVAERLPTQVDRHSYRSDNRRGSADGRLPVFGALATAIVTAPLALPPTSPVRALTGLRGSANLTRSPADCASLEVEVLELPPLRDGADNSPRGSDLQSRSSE